MAALSWVALAFILLLCDMSAAEKKHPSTTVHRKNSLPLVQSWQWNPNHYWYHKHYYKKKKTQYPRIKGRCKPPPPIIINGTDIIGQETQKGNVVVLVLSKRTCRFCTEQLGSLNNHAVYFGQEQMNVTIVVLNHRWYPMPKAFKSIWKHIKIYNEPKKSRRLFKKLGGSYGDFLIFDKCKRQQYLIRRPYSWLGWPYMRTAVYDTHYHFESLCGECEPEPEVGPEDPDFAVTTRQPATTRATKPITNIDGPDETVDNSL